MNNETAQLVDGFGRRVDYLRISVTDRCDFRCVYCMAEKMTFLPKAKVLSLEELEQIATAFVKLGVRKIRLTGGEPLIRHNIMQLIENLGALPGLEELVLTTNGSQLHRLAPDLKKSGVRRINISIDSLKPRRFHQITRFGHLEQVLAGIDAACEAGFERIRLNAVIMRGRNDDEVLDLVAFAQSKGIDLAFIEEMPLGHIVEHDRALSLASSDWLMDVIAQEHKLCSLGDPQGSAGPARMYQLNSGPSRVGFISPHSNNFCHLCNRVRLTAEGRLLLCLGNEHSADLRAVVRDPHGTDDSLRQAIIDSMSLKPERHYFDLEEEPQILRFMNATGG
ncbi:MAG: GTP 3',8-cyclase MoaA [Pseudomonadota bacterium]